MAKKYPLFVFDYETTGVDTNTLTPVEFAFAIILIDNKEVEVLQDTKSYLIDHDTHPRDFWWQPGALDLAYKTGLYEDLADDWNTSKVTLEELDNELMDVVEEYPFMGAGGSGIGEFDRLILRRFHPQFEKHLSYRATDLGSFRNVLKVLGIWDAPMDEYPFGGFDGAHRAADDVNSFIDQYRYFAKRVTVE